MSEALPLVESEDLVLVRDSARGLLQDAWPASRAVAVTVTVSVRFTVFTCTGTSVALPRVTCRSVMVRGSNAVPAPLPT